MNILSDCKNRPFSRTQGFGKNLYYAFLFIPLPFINAFLEKLVKHIRDKRPEMFDRLEGHHHKWFLIDPVNLPFALCLRPDPIHPELRAYRKYDIPETEGKIAGSFLTLLGMIDGRYDGDALFFTRDIHVGGDTEAVVCLRNALDDVDGSIADDVADFFGAPGHRILKIVRRVSTYVHKR